MTSLPLDLFPGFSSVGLVSPAVIALATTFNAEGVSALSGIPPQTVAWADVGSRVTKMSIGQGLIPIRMTSLLGFEKMEGERHYHPLSVSTVKVGVNPYSLALEWPVQVQNSNLADVYGISGVASDVVEHARAYKADLLASLIIAGMTNSALSMTAKAYTLPQPGLANGLPLFSDGSTSGSTKHYSNPIDSNSKQFANLFLNAGKITDSGVMSTVLTNMTQVPHPSKADMTLGLQVTDIFGGTNMLGRCRLSRCRQRRAPETSALLRRTYSLRKRSPRQTRSSRRTGSTRFDITSRRSSIAIRTSSRTRPSRCGLLFLRLVPA